MGWNGWIMAARKGTGPLKFARPLWFKLQGFRLPVFRPLAALLWAERDFRAYVWPLIAKVLYREPMLRYRCAQVGRRLQMEGSLPEIVGDGRIVIGDDVRIGGRNTWVVGSKVLTGAELVIGNRVAINYQTLISVARRVEIGDDTLIAGNVRIFDNTNHPLSPSRRLANEPFSPEESRPIVIGRNVWIGQSAMIMKGVTIGDNSVVAAGAIVTKSVPANTLVGGNPARILRALGELPEDSSSSKA